MTTLSPHFSLESPFFPPYLNVPPILMRHPFVLVKRVTISLSRRSDFDMSLSAVLPSSSMACGSAPLQKGEINDKTDNYGTNSFNELCCNLTNTIK